MLRLRIGSAVCAGAVAIVVVAPARLPPEATGRDRLDGNRRWPPAGLAEALLVERAGNVQANVHPDQVHQLERTHPEPAAHPADLVDLLHRRGSLLQQLQRLEAEWTIAPVDEETRSVGRRD